MTVEEHLEMESKNISPIVLTDASLPKGDAETVILAAGDFCPINRFEEKILSGGRIFDKQLHGIFRRKDIFVVNQEAVLGDNSMSPASAAGYGLRCSPEIAPYMKSMGVDCAGLANNHIRDFRDEGVISTLRALDSAGIKTFGAGADIYEASKPLFIVSNGLKICLWAVAERELNIAGENHAGAAAFIPELNTKVIPGLKKQSDFLLIYVHAGHEFMTAPSPRIRECYRKFIVAGADMVIGHHPHVIQGGENYRGKWILYSLGNFVFDSAYVSGYSCTDIGFLARITVAARTVARLEIIPYRIDSSVALVRHLSDDEIKDFEAVLEKISANIYDDKKFYSEWEKNVKTRWEKDYRKILAEFSACFRDEENKDFPRRMRNLFTCPTHAEIMEKISYMLEEGKISRTENERIKK